MQISDKKNIWLLTTIAIACHIPVKAADWNISAPEIVGVGHETDRAVINDNIKATGVSEAAIEINGSLGGILINVGKSLETQAGFWNGSALTPDTASINLTATGEVTETVENRGYIRNGVNVDGRISVNNDSALTVEGASSTNKAVILQSVAIRNGGYVKSENEHAINISQHGFIDFVNIEMGGFLGTDGNGKSAIYVAQNGMLGGELVQEAAPGDVLFYPASDATPIVNIQGEVTSVNGSGIKIDGAAQGAIVVSNGELTGSRVSGEAAIRVNGNYYGSVQNYGGTIDGGISVAGNHSAATTVNPILANVPAALAAGDRSAYISAGVAAKYAELKGGYSVLNGGTVEAHNNHAIFLNEYSKADFISVAGTLETAAAGKSAVYVADNASLGDNGDLAAIEIKSGGEISSTRGTAVTVDGSFIGWVYVHGGKLLAEDETTNVVDFSGADSALKFTQGESSAVTRGNVIGSALDTDVIEILGGQLDGGTIADVETMLFSNSTIATDTISGVEGLIFNSGTLTNQASIIGSAQTDDYMTVSSGTISSQSISGIEKMTLNSGSITSSTISGLNNLTIKTGANLHVSGNFTAPASTTIEVQSGYNPDSAVITVEQALSANSGGSEFIVMPGSAAAFNELVDQKVVTVIDYNDGLTGDLSNSFTSSAASEAEYIRRDHLLFDVSQTFEQGKFKINIIPRELDILLAGIEATDQQRTLLLNAIRAAISENGANTEKQNAMLAALTEDNINSLLSNIEQINPADLQGLQAVQQVVLERIQVMTGMGFGDTYFDYDDEEYYPEYDEGGSYGPSFSFLGGAGWGQLLYGSSRHDSIKGSSGFDGKLSGFVVGLDTDLTNTFRVGGAGSWTQNKLTGDNHASTHTHNFMATLYGHWYIDGWYTDAIFSMGRSTSDTGKVILGKDITANYKSGSMGARFITGHKFSMGSWDISPQAEFHYGRITFDVYEEKGDTGFEQKIEIKDYNVMEYGLGFRLGLPTEDGYRIRPEFNLMGYYDIKNTGTEVEASYLAGGDSFVITGPSRDQFRAKMGLSVDIDIMDNWSLDTSYNLNLSKHFLSHNFSAKARYEF